MVTGAGSGIGKCVAVALAQNGYSVVLVGRRKEPLEATALEVRQANSQTLVVPTDVNDPASVRELFAKTKDAFGRLDLLFNNAGISAPRHAARGLDLRAVEVGGRYESHRHVSVHAGSIQNHEEPEAARRADHQQRLHFRAQPSAEFRPLHGFKTRSHRPHESDFSGRPSARHRLRPDRHWKRVDRNDRTNEEGRSASKRHERGRAHDGSRRRGARHLVIWRRFRSTPMSSS